MSQNYSDSLRVSHNAGTNVVFQADFSHLRDQVQDMQKNFSRKLTDIEMKTHNDISKNMKRIMNEVDMKIDSTR